jgi:DNA-binding Lrp family transcriptional regulator
LTSVEPKGSSLTTGIARFTIDLSFPESIAAGKKVDPVKLMEQCLIMVFPDYFMNRDKHLQLALIIYENYLRNKRPSLSDLAEKLGWNRGSKGAVSNYIKELAELEFIDKKTGKFNPNFIQKMYGEVSIKLCYYNILLNHIKSLFKEQSFIQEGSFVFSNAGQLLQSLIMLFKKVPEGDEVYMILKEGSTWGSEGIGGVMRMMLENLIKTKGVKLKVLTTRLMNKELRDFFTSIGEVVIDEEISKSDRRWFYGGGYVVEVIKIPGIRERPGDITGVIRVDVLDEKNNVAKRRFEELKRLHSKQNVEYC